MVCKLGVGRLGIKGRILVAVGLVAVLGRAYFPGMTDTPIRRRTAQPDPPPAPVVITLAPETLRVLKDIEHELTIIRETMQSWETR